MKEIGTPLLWSVVGGLVTAVVILAISQYWKNVVIPWLENLVYRGARIDGLWEAEYEICGQVKPQFVNLVQQAHNISGTITYPADTKGRPHVYSFKGLFFDNTLTAVAEEHGKARVDRGALVLVLQPGLSEIVMQGQSVWLQGSRLVTAPYKWRRITD